jgi:hypothetical protein
MIGMKIILKIILKIGLDITYITMNYEKSWKFPFNEIMISQSQHKKSSI